MLFVALSFMALATAQANEMIEYDGQVYSPEAEYRGIFRYGFESYHFSQCGEEESWRVVPIDDAIASQLEGGPLDQTAPSQYGPERGIEPWGIREAVVRGRLTVSQIEAVRFTGEVRPEQADGNGIFDTWFKQLLVVDVLSSEVPEDGRYCEGE